jgi:F-type H+-transporting ATPase subunit gamma
MSHLVQLRHKIRSIQSTKKITHALRLVSMSSYNKLDKANAPLNVYAQSVKSFFREILTYAPEWKSTLLFPQDVLDAQPLYIIVATSKGLCGSLNSNLLRYLDTALFIEKQQKPTFIAIGQKAINYVKEHDLGELAWSYTELNSSNFIALADDLVDKITNSPITYSSVSFFSSYAKSFFSQHAQKFTLIPIALDASDKANGTDKAKPVISREDEESFDAPIWEQDKEQILDYLAIRYLRSSIIHILFQALRAEHAARFLAMENSTNNAEKYLEKLTLLFNKTRQALITKEVSELSASFPVR